MEGVDRRIVSELYERHTEFRRLFDEHQKIHDMLSPFEHRIYLTPEETAREKELKLKKLKGRERMLSIIDEHRQPLYQDVVNA